MTAQVLVIGLDAAEATLIERWMGEGNFPNLARISQRGAVARLGNPMDTLPGGIWPEIWSGQSSAKTGLFYHPEQIRTGETALRPIEHDEVDATDNYWSLASKAGRRVCVIDQVQAALDNTLNGIQLLEWGLHDRTFEERSHPPELITEIHNRYGRHPVRRCDAYPGNDTGRQELLEDLIEGSIAKRRLVLELMAREPWDLFTCTLSESHCVGHHFWGCFDDEARRGASTMPAKHRDGIQTIYRQLDETIGALVDAAGPQCTVLVVASHGIGPAHAGYHLLPEFLARMGMSSDAGTASRFPLRHLQTRIKYSVPIAWLPLLRFLCRLGPVKAVQSRTGAMRFPLESPKTRAIAIPNNRVGAIRLNLNGREPHGSVAPGNEATAIMEELREELLRLIDPSNGEPVVERVTLADEAFGPDHHPDIPDLMVVFRTGRGPIETAYSERVGRIGVSYFTRRVHRFGDHTVESRLWAAGPGIPKDVRVEGAHVLDIAPTVLSLLDVLSPARLEGRPICFNGA